MPTGNTAAIGGCFDDLGGSVLNRDLHIEIKGQGVINRLLQRYDSLIAAGLPKHEGLGFQIGHLLGYANATGQCTAFGTVKGGAGLDGQLIATDGIGKAITVLKGAVCQYAIGICQRNRERTITLFGHLVCFSSRIVPAGKTGQNIVGG